MGVVVELYCSMDMYWRICIVCIYSTLVQSCTVLDTNITCVLPFIYQGTTYTGCTDVSDEEGQYWCATYVDADGFYVPNSKQYGYCGKGCPLHSEEDIQDDLLRTIDDEIVAT